MSTIHRSLKPTHIVLGIFFAFILAAQPFAAQAQSGSIGGRPANPDSTNARTKSIFVKTINKGETQKDAVIVVNNTPEEKTVIVYATDSVASSGGAFACAQAADAPVSVGKWTSLDKTEVVLGANSTEEVRFTITAPQDAEPGEQNGCIVLQEKKEDSFKGGIALNFRTAIRVAVMVPGDIQKELTLLELKIKQQQNKVIISPSVKNTGSVSLDTAIKTSISTIIGMPIESQESTYPVLRDQITEWNFEFAQPFWGGLYAASYQASYDESAAFLSENSDTKLKTINSTPALFFVTPHPAALLIELAVIGALATAIVLLVRRRALKEEIKKDWKEYIVKTDDDIQRIAKKHQIDWKLLAKANSIKAPYTLSEDQTLLVPGKKSAFKKRPPRKI